MSTIKWLEKKKKKIKIHWRIRQCLKEKKIYMKKKSNKARRGKEGIKGASYEDGIKRSSITWKVWPTGAYYTGQKRNVKRKREWRERKRKGEKAQGRKWTKSKRLRNIIQSIRRPLDHERISIKPLFAI